MAQKYQQMQLESPHDVCTLNVSTSCRWKT